MDRRAFITGLGAVLAAPRAAAAQQAGKMWRIGFLTPAEVHWDTFVEALRALGYIEGQTVRFDVRTAENDLGRLRSSPLISSARMSTSSSR
jgi:putative tryptophan/tyrosine transport system substrate-binding protein